MLIYTKFEYSFIHRYYYLCHLR